MAFCTVERDGAILLVTMNQPEKLNALAPGSHDEMAAIFNAFEDDPGLHLAILTGAGRAFCAGSDIAAYVAGTSRPLPPEGGAGLTHNRRLSKPVIAAVNGLAMGGGFEIALACDFIVSDAAARFALPEPRVGAAALGGGLAQLARKLPAGLAMRLALSGDPLTAEDAHRFGLVTDLAPKGQAVAVARAIAARILEGSPLSLRITRRVVRLAIEGASTDEIEREEAALRRKSMASADFAEGMAAFAEKRKPVWTGR